MYSTVASGFTYISTCYITDDDDGSTTNRCSIKFHERENVLLYDKVASTRTQTSSPATMCSSAALLSTCAHLQTQSTKGFDSACKIDFQGWYRKLLTTRPLRDQQQLTCPIQAAAAGCGAISPACTVVSLAVFWGFPFASHTSRCSWPWRSRAAGSSDVVSRRSCGAANLAP